MVSFTPLHFKDIFRKAVVALHLALKSAVSTNAITLVFFCFPELVLLQVVTLVQFRPGQMRLSTVSHFRWLNSYLIGLVQYTDNHNVRLSMIWELCNFLSAPEAIPSMISAKVFGHFLESAPTTVPNVTN